MIEEPWPLPTSDLFEIRETPYTGKAVFARKGIVAGTLLLKTSASQSPLVHMIQKPFKRETCALCFAYDRGREWKVRDTSIGLAYCSEQCRAQWYAQTPGIIVDAHRIVEDSNKQMKRSQANRTPYSPEDLEDDVLSAWEEAAILGRQIVRARLRDKQSKLDRKLIRRARELLPDVDIISYLLSGLTAVYLTTAILDSTTHHDDAGELDALMLPALLQLAPNSDVYDSSLPGHAVLNDYVEAYQLLLAILPEQLVPYLSTELCHELASRASHNAFSIRPEGNSDGDQSGEFLGWGVWPEASFFNHSCRPNVMKRRSGRQWLFSVVQDQDVTEGEELCITYLGGDEKDLDVIERRKTLQEQWGFNCNCARCSSEDESKSLSSLDADSNQISVSNSMNAITTTSGSYMTP